MFGSHARAARYYRDAEIDQAANLSKAIWVRELLKGILDQVAIAKVHGQAGVQGRAQRASALSKAGRILDEGLLPWLDKEQGGALAGQLEMLYQFCLIALLEANASGDDARLHDVERSLEPLLDAWTQIAKT